MAYPLQRITFATCDPDFKLYAFMTNSPTPMGVAVHGHVFVGRSPTQVCGSITMYTLYIQQAYIIIINTENFGSGSRYGSSFISQTQLKIQSFKFGCYNSEL